MLPVGQIVSLGSSAYKLIMNKKDPVERTAESIQKAVELGEKCESTLRVFGKEIVCLTRESARNVVTLASLATILFLSRLPMRYRHKPSRITRISDEFTAIVLALAIARFVYTLPALKLTSSKDNIEGVTFTDEPQSDQGGNDSKSTLLRKKIRFWSFVCRQLGYNWSCGLSVCLNK